MIITITFPNPALRLINTEVMKEKRGNRAEEHPNWGLPKMPQTVRETKQLWSVKTSWVAMFLMGQHYIFHLSCEVSHNSHNPLYVLRWNDSTDSS